MHIISSGIWIQYSDMHFFRAFCTVSEVSTLSVPNKEAAIYAQTLWTSSGPVRLLSNMWSYHTVVGDYLGFHWPRIMNFREPNTFQKCSMDKITMKLTTLVSWYRCQAGFIILEGHLKQKKRKESLRLVRVQLSHYVLMPNLCLFSISLWRSFAMEG